MSAMRATQELVHEHDIILSMLRALEQALDEAGSTGTVPVELLKRAVTFSQGFVDRCHHAKEERCLFPCLESRGIPRDGGPIGVMLHEHEVGRSLVRQIAGQLDLYAGGHARAGDVLEPARAYLELLRQHIHKENAILFPMGDGVTDDRDDAQTLECFQAREAEMGRGEHERLVGLVQTMAEEA